MAEVNIYKIENLFILKMFKYLNSVVIQLKINSVRFSSKYVPLSAYNEVVRARIRGGYIRQTYDSCYDYLAENYNNPLFDIISEKIIPIHLYGYEEGNRGAIVHYKIKRTLPVLYALGYKFTCYNLLCKVMKFIKENTCHNIMIKILNML